MNAWELLDQGIVAGYSGYWQIAGRACTVTIEPRPHYCDRGRWIAKVHAAFPFARDIDAADLWPRYYFDLERAKLEVEAWLDVRGQRV